MANDLYYFEAASSGLTTATTSYSSGDMLGSEISITNAVNSSGGTGRLDTITVVDYAKKIGSIELFFFNAASSGAAADNAAENYSDQTQFIGSILLPAPTTYANWYAVTLTNVGFHYNCSATTLYMGAVTRSAHSFFGAATDLKFKFGMIRG